MAMTVHITHHCVLLLRKCYRSKKILPRQVHLSIASCTCMEKVTIENTMDSQNSLICLIEFCAICIQGRYE